jgi:hypothetical protein
VMEFHIPYYVLRRGMPSQDGRMLQGKRLRRSEILPLAENEHSDQHSYHEAQSSFLVTGVDDFFWTSYCFVDTYYGSERMKSTYLSALDGVGIDPASCRTLVFPYWNPREYLLAVFATRMRQATMEWRNLIRNFDRRMKYYVSCVSSLPIGLIITRKSHVSITRNWIVPKIFGLW